MTTRELEYGVKSGNTCLDDSLKAAVKTKVSDAVKMELEKNNQQQNYRLSEPAGIDTARLYSVPSKLDAAEADG